MHVSQRAQSHVHGTVVRVVVHVLEVMILVGRLQFLVLGEQESVLVVFGCTSFPETKCSSQVGRNGVKKKKRRGSEKRGVSVYCSHKRSAGIIVLQVGHEPLALDKQKSFYKKQEVQGDLVNTWQERGMRIISRQPARQPEETSKH